MCTRIGADGFAERAFQQLEAAGGSTPRRRPRYDPGLTTRERHISRVVIQGLTNAEIADQLPISHRTVEWHFRNIFDKLGITSRRELRHVDELGGPQAHSVVQVDGSWRAVSQKGPVRPTDAK